MLEAFDIRRPHRPVADGVYVLTDHAVERMRERRIDAEAVEAAMTYGRFVRQDRRQGFVIGRKEVARYAEATPERAAVDLSPWEGVMVCVNARNYIETVYRRRDFRPLRRPRHRDRGARRRMAYQRPAQ